VSISYQGETVRIWQESPMPDAASQEAIVSGDKSDVSQEIDEGPVVVDLTSEPTVSLQSCGDCGSTAIYYTPSGLACSYHAWEAASMQEGTGVDFWIPIMIERTR
jgi:hypothetical protein